MNHPAYVYTCPVGAALSQNLIPYFVFIFGHIVYSLYVKKMCFSTKFVVLAVISGKSLATLFGIL